MANFSRHRVRTVLTVGSFAVALFLFGLLITIRAAFNQGVEAAGADRLVVINKVSLIQPLPLAYRDRIARVSGVQHLTYANWFGGVYQDERNFFPQFAVHHETWRSMYPEFRVPDDQWRAFEATRTGAIAGRALVDRFGWKVGDRIPIRGTIFTGEWAFDLVGIYEGTRPQDDLTQFWFRWDHLNERAEAWARGYVGWYVVKLAPGHDAVQVTKTIDAAFQNSAFETRTQTEQAFMASFVEQFGNIGLLVTVIGSVVFFTLLLVTGNTMAMAVRERTAELAVLKTIGFRDGRVVALVLVEACAIALAGGALGILLAKLFTLGGDPTGGLFASFYLPPWAIAVGVAVALAVGLLSSLPPALSAGRLRVVEALRRL